MNLQLFCSEIDDVETGLLIEVWDKGMLWDKAIGYFWAPLQSLQLSAVVSSQTLLSVLSKAVLQDTNCAFFLGLNPRRHDYYLLEVHKIGYIV